MTKNKTIAILDNSVLSALDELNALKYLNLLFNKVYIPVDVEREFLEIPKLQKQSRRFNLLMEFYALNAWLFKCETRDEAIYKLLTSSPKLHRGESDVIAQYKELEQRGAANPQALVVVLDDKNARDVAQRQNISLTGTLKLLSRLHFLNALDYNASVEQLQRRGKRYSQQAIRDAFEQAKQEFEIQ